MKTEIIVGSRQSQLALCQTQLVIDQLKGLHPELTFTLKRIVTQGDRDQKSSLKKVGGKGIFVKELENDLLSGDVDFAVHSLKDVMPELPQGLILSSFPKRESPYDCLISQMPLTSMMALPQRARVGTNSARREGQLLHVRPDIEIVPIRGNIDTRLKKLDSEHLDAIILAEAGINRLGLDLGNKYRLSLKDDLMPSMGQGAMAIECREDNAFIRNLLHEIQDEPTARCVSVERDFLRAIGGTCTFPIGGHAVFEDQKRIRLSGLIASTDGQHLFTIERVSDRPEELGQLVADELLAADNFGILKGS